MNGLQQYDRENSKYYRSGYECFYLVDVHTLMFLMMLICADLFRSSAGDRFA
jgi:hypothetical protein